MIFMPLALLYYCLAAMYFMFEGITQTQHSWRTYREKQFENHGPASTA